jgi:hypothetical protein
LCVAPAVAAVVITLIAAYAEGARGEFFSGAAVVALVGTYPTAIVVGLPGYLVCRRYFEPRLSNCAVLGTLMAIVPWAIIIHPAGWWLGAFGLAGAISGAMFWAIALRGRKEMTVR